MQPQHREQKIATHRPIHPARAQHHSAALTAQLVQYRLLTSSLAGAVNPQRIERLLGPIGRSLATAKHKIRAQLQQPTARGLQRLGERSRLIVRGEAGSTFAGEVVDIPPTLRFYAGGDRSVRGYAWREIGPRIPAAPGRTAYALGARNALVGSVEFEQYFDDTWGMAVFADSGSAFDDTPDRFRTGVGVGLRWRSPVGPLRLDVARGLDDPDASFTLHLNLGADL